MSGESPAGGAHGEHLLLTVLGTNPRRACYTVGDREVEAKLAPVALFDLLPAADRPDRVLAICTPEAKQQTWPILERELERRCGVGSVDVPSGDVQKDINTCLEKITDAIPENVDLTVDVTHGFRHFSFLTYIAVLYLAALRGVRVRGAYYGLLRPNDTSPFLDLRPLLDLPRWVHALEVLRETGSAVPMAETIRDAGSKQIVATIACDLSYFSEGYLSGLPLELGRQAKRLREQRLKPLRKLLVRGHNLPLAGELVERLDRILEPFTLVESARGEPWKRRVALSEDELKRQARIIDDLLRHENVATALGLMNEWTVSWVAWRWGDASEWLDFHKVRRKSARLLGAVEAVGRDPGLSHILTDEQRSLADFWRKLSDLRNAYHHHGMRPQVLIGDGKAESQLRDVRKFWAETLRSCPDFRLSLGESPGGRVLVSPIGRRPGVLFSAINACRADGEDPGRCLVICAGETEGLISEASRHADYTGALEPLRLEDPHGGRAEIERLVKAARRHFVGAEEVLVNVTGGTTLMGLAAEGLANAARRLACPVRRFGLIDRRTPQEQDADPYRIGEPFWLEPGEDGDAGDH